MTDLSERLRDRAEWMVEEDVLTLRDAILAGHKQGAAHRMCMNLIVREGWGVMTRAEHYTEAERLLELAANLGGKRTDSYVANLVAMARVHAMLAGDHSPERWG